MIAGNRFNCKMLARPSALVAKTFAALTDSGSVESSSSVQVELYVLVHREPLAFNRRSMASISAACLPSMLTQARLSSRLRESWLRDSGSCIDRPRQWARGIPRLVSGPRGQPSNQDSTRNVAWEASWASCSSPRTCREARRTIVA